LMTVTWTLTALAGYRRIMMDTAYKEFQLLLLQNGATLKPGAKLTDLDIPDYVPADWTLDE
jgi:hypothetical protein